MAGIDSYVQLMLHGWGTNGSTTFTDDSQNNSIQTHTGTVAISTAEYEFTTGEGASAESSIGFNQSAQSYVTAPWISAFELGSGNFTVDCWIYMATLSSTTIVYGRTTNASTSYSYLQIANGVSEIRYVDYNSSAYVINAMWTSPVTFAINTWYHIALVRNGTSFTVYINGTAATATSGTTSSNTITSRTVSLDVGGSSFNTNYYLRGYMDEFRYSVGIARWTTNFTPPTSPYSSSSSPTVTPSTFNLLSTLYSPSLVISSLVEPSNFNLISTLYSPVITSFKSVNPSTFNLTSTLYSPSLLISSVVHPSLLTLTTTLHQPNIIAPGTNSISFASAILSYNPLIIVSNTNPVKVSIVDVSTPDNPIYTTHSYAGCSNATAVSYNSDLGMIYVSCADGIILEINASSPTSYTINYTDASGNLTSLAILPDFFDVYAGTDYSTGETVNMYEGSATTVACDVRFSSLTQTTISTMINTINAQSFSTDIRFSGIINDTIGCDIRFISTSYADLSITPIARTDFVVYIGGVECPDVKLDSIEIVHTADEKSQATFILARKHDNVNYVLNPDGTQGSYIPVLNNPTVQITIAGNKEFGYDTPAYIWDVDCKSENEQVKIIAYSELPPEDDVSSVTLSIPLVNEKLHVYHALINNPIIDNPLLLPDDITPPFYLGILIDNGYTRIQNVTQFYGSNSFNQSEKQYVNFIFGSGDSGITDIYGTNEYFKPVQNWTYFWFGHSTNFITGQSWTGFLNSGSSYLGTSPSALTVDTWSVDYIYYNWQRIFPDSEYRGGVTNVQISEYGQPSYDGIGSSTVYPSDFLGIIPFPYNPDAYDNVVGINPYGNSKTINEVLRNHTPVGTYTGADILTLKQKLTLYTNPGSTSTWINGVNYLITVTGELEPLPLNVSTKIIDVIDSKFGITIGSAPYKKVSSKSGILTPAYRWVDAPNGLYINCPLGYDYKEYTQLVMEAEYLKLQNINGSVLPKTKCDIELFLDGYYFYNISVLKRINIEQTVQPNIYNKNNGFPVSVKSIHISSKDMKVTLECNNSWSRYEMLEIEGTIPDPNSYLIPEILYQYPGGAKFDPNILGYTS